MGAIKNALLGAISGLALLSGFTPDSMATPPRAPIVENRYGERPTPRHPQRRKALPTASPHRAALRLKARNAYRKQLRKEREIGIDPIYWNAPNSRVQPLSALRAVWQERSRRWDRENAKAVA